MPFLSTFHLLHVVRKSAARPENLTGRHSDNVGILITYMSRQNGTDPNDIRAYLEIGEDFEDIC